MTDPVHDLVTSLRPDDVLDEAHRRRRAADLARAMATPPRRAGRPRGSVSRWGYLLAGAVAAGVAGALVLPPVLTAPVAQPSSGARSSVAAGAAPGAVTGGDKVTLTPRSFLLAAAETAARGPEERGRYWYERVRTVRPGHGPEVAETWYSGRDGLIVSGGKRREFSGLTLKWRVGGHDVTLDDMRRLPGDAGALRAWLGDADPFTAAFRLLGSAATPDTRAAMFAVLSEQPGLAIDRDATDSLGRRGVAVTGPTAVLIIDPADARLLSVEFTRSTGEPRREGRSIFIPSEAGTVLTYEAATWTDTTERP
jgi:hypothetical protein